MRADEPIITWADIILCSKGDILDYINQLRYERLMAKAKCFWYKSAKMQMADQAGYAIPDYNRRIDRIENIALAYGARARRIKEGM